MHSYSQQILKIVTRHFLRRIRRFEVSFKASCVVYTSSQCCACDQFVEVEVLVSFPKV